MHRAESAPGNPRSRDGVPQPGRRRRLRWLAVVALLTSSLLHAEGDPGSSPGQAPGSNPGQVLPPRAEWRATASSKQVAALAPAHAIDGDIKTRWGGAFSADHWLQVDLGRAAEVGGVAIHWDSGFAASYRIQTSLDGKAWHDAYTSTDSRGDTDYLFFPAAKARYVRLASMPRTADWGVSIFEFEPIAARDAARISGLADGIDAATLFGARGPVQGTLQQAGEQPGTRRIEIALPRADQVAGLEVWWGGPRDGATLEMQGKDGAWTTLAEDPGTLGDVVLSRRARSADAARAAAHRRRARRRACHQTAAPARPEAAC